MKKFQGIIPALVTPFDETDKINCPSLEKLLRRVYDGGVHGVYLNGSTGEGLLQSIENRKLTAEIAIKNSPPEKQVIVHVGAATTADSIALARHASQLGASAVSCLPPSGNYSFDEVKTYYRSVAAASDVPLLAYYFPAANPIIKSADELLEICALPNIFGLKFTDFNLFVLSTIKKSGAVVFNGYDEVLVAGLLMGADGGIGTTYSLMPRVFIELYEAAQRGDWVTARKSQEQINELVNILLRFPVFPATKAVLEWLGIDCGQCLAPRRALTEQEKNNLLNLLKNSSVADILLTS